MNMLYVSVGLRGAVWGVDTQGKGMMRSGVTRDAPYGTGWEEQPGANLRQLEVGDCQVYGTTNMHEIYRLDGCRSTKPLGTGWVQVGGTLRHIAVGEGPVLWGVDYAHQVWFKSVGESRKDVDEDKEANWDAVLPLDKNMVQLDVGRDGMVWAVGSDGTVFFRLGIEETKREGTSWEAQPKDAVTTETNGVANEVAICTNGHVWIRGADNKLYYRMRITDQDPKGQEWVLDDTVGSQDVTSISCGLEGQFAFVQDNQVVIKRAVTNDDPAGLLSGTTTLSQASLQFQQVSIGEQGQLYALSDDNKIYYRKGRTNAKLEGTMWEQVDTYAFKQMDAGNNELYAVTMFNEVYRRDGLVWNDQAQNLVGTDWIEVKGWMQYVSTAEEGIVWAIDVEYDVWVLETGSISIRQII